MNSEADEHSPSGVADLAVYDTASMPDEATTEVYTSEASTSEASSDSDGPMGAAAPEPEGNQDADEHPNESVEADGSDSCPSGDGCQSAAEMPWEFDAYDTGQGPTAAYHNILTGKPSDVVLLTLAEWEHMDCVAYDADVSGDECE
jgi:hypothetical protein